LKEDLCPGLMHQDSCDRPDDTEDDKIKSWCEFVA